MTVTRRPSCSLLPARSVRADAAVGTAGRSPLAALRERFGPSAIGAVAGGRSFPFAAPDWPESIPRPEPDSALGVDYDTAWSRRYGVRLARAMVLDNVARPIVRLVAAPLVRGDDALCDLPSPVIFAANHASHADTPLLISCLPRRFRHRTVVAAAADYFFDRKWKAATWSFLLAVFPIERARVNRRSAQLAADLVADGWNLVIFPEGGRSPDGWGQTFTGGAAYLALRTGVPVVPVHLEGTRRILPKGRTRLQRTATTITFGLPLRPRADENARRFGARIETAIATLADETDSDWWTARKRAAAGTTPSLQGPSVGAWRRSWALDASDGSATTSDRWPRTSVTR